MCRHDFTSSTARVPNSYVGPWNASCPKSQVCVVERKAALRPGEFVRIDWRREVELLGILQAISSD